MSLASNFHGLQYIELMKRIKNEGVWVKNERTGKKCLTVINADLTYNLDFKEIKPGVYKFKIPLDTTRKSFWKSAVAEILAYIRGYDNAADFRQLGTKTWDANANKNTAWLNNKYRKGEDDMGRVYGVQGRSWAKPDGGEVDQLAKIIKELENNYDDRGEILNFYNPGEFHMGCLRPCMYSHHFSLLDGKLFLNSTQRSDDVLLGHNFNQVQVATFLAITGISTNHKPTTAYHKIVNAHFYEDQVKLLEQSGHLEREPFEDPYMIVDTTLEHTANKKGLELLEALDLRNFSVENYQHHDAIKYPFSV